jgi:hypothetical protein
MKHLEADRIRPFVINLVLLKKKSHRKVRVKRRSNIFFKLSTILGFYFPFSLSIILKYKHTVSIHITINQHNKFGELEFYF